MTTQLVLATLGMVAVGYLAGSIPFSFLVAKAHGVDLRTVGSGNIGGSNVWRSVGFSAFLMAVVGDLLKGTLPTLAAMYLLGLPPAAVVLVGVAAILGHTFPLFLGFKGGKAVATSGGVLVAISPLMIAIALAIWAVVFAVGRISSVASLAGAASVGITSVVMLAMGVLPLPYTLLSWVAVTVIFYLHRENIQRLREGRENKFQKLF
ncbi:glycerol-3-phosphate 1-O-acyltransferase PlsY [Chloroflexia bacterium SDU3-3]|nr:glycerol-3-phosphate 1-O-acyltransferase PlsY [Chloroflexia bacterium SDU3-3]